MVNVTRGDMTDTVTVVGNLIGAATVDAVPRAAGRLQDVYVKMGDHVRMGQRIAKIEDREILEQVKQAEASYAVSQATIRQRQADLKLALNNLERSRSLFERDLLPHHPAEQRHDHGRGKAALNLRVTELRAGAGQNQQERNPE